MKNTIMVLPKGANIELGKFFNSREFDCKCSYSSCTKTLIDIEHLEQLIILREEKQAPIKINSGYRCKKHNKDVGGSPTSQHTKGTATDIVVKGWLPRKLANYLLTTSWAQMFWGIGAYDTFTHIDSRRNRKAKWGFNAK